jgi:hypothetical protein
VAADAPNGDSPTDAHTFLVWRGKQDDETKKRIARIAKSKNLPSMIKEWNDAEAMAVFHALNETSKFSRNGR